MPFIGIISDYKDEKIIKNILKEKLSNEVNIININEKSIENLKNIKFETILITYNNSIIKEKKELLKRIISNSEYLILNADMEIEIEIYQDKELNVITFGFNPKATITASSVEQEILLCVQRTIKNIKKNKIEQQEIKISFFQNKGLNINNIIGLATIMLLYDKIGK